MMQDVLNENQRFAAAHRDGPMMVLAGPGSGKTTVITYRALGLIRQGVKPGNILIITYSKAAAEQMRKRFETMSGETGVMFGTFHAVFYRVLRNRYRYLPDQILKEDERRAAVRRMLSVMGYELEDEFLTGVLNELSLVKNELFDLRYYHSAAIGAEDFKSLFDQYEAYKDEREKIDFDDMLTRCYALFSNEPAVLEQIRGSYPYIMIDEFQDINRVQYECVRMLAEPKRNLFIVGDDDQSIYRFRGARPEFLLNFPNDYPETGRVVLDLNYRSSDVIIDFSNKIIAGNRVRYGKKIAGTGRQSVRPEFLRAEDQNREAAVIAERIRALRQKGADLNGIAVIYRVNLQARAFIDAFMQANIPYQVKDEASVLYEHWIAQDLAAYLRLSRRIPSGYDPDAERIINRPYRYIGKAFLQSAKKAHMNIFEVYTRDPSLHVQSKTRIEELLFYLQAAGKRSTVDAVRYIRGTAGYDDYIKEHCQYRKLNPAGLYEIADELQEAAKQFPQIDEYLFHMEDAVRAAKENKKTQTDCVTLTTMHSAKGLEFDTVYIAGAVDGVIPHERSKTDAELEEERRLLYVGVTRARHQLCISIPRTRYDKSVKPSRFLEKIE